MFRNETALDWAENEVLTESETLNEERPMSKNHSRAFFQLNAQLIKYQDKYDIMPEFDIKLSTGKVKPDIAICQKGLKFNWWKDETYTEVVPLSVIEILSPKQPLDEVVQKITETFFAGGVQSAWLVLPSLQSIYVVTPDLNRTPFFAGEFTDPVTGITLKVEDIFK